jgi:hypothetical protein
MVRRCRGSRCTATRADRRTTQIGPRSLLREGRGPLHQVGGRATVKGVSLFCGWMPGILSRSLEKRFCLMPSGPSWRRCCRRLPGGVVVRSRMIAVWLRGSSTASGAVCRGRISRPNSGRGRRSGSGTAVTLATERGPDPRRAADRGRRGPSRRLSGQRQLNDQPRAPARDHPAARQGAVSNYKICSPSLIGRVTAVSTAGGR